MLRLIGKWLHAGALDDGAVTYPDAGTPRSGVLSALLADIFLHEVTEVDDHSAIGEGLAGILGARRRHA
jgi:hypothetical protein